MPSEPLATVCVPVERGKAPAHAADPPSPVTLAAEQVTVTAETGTVGQLVNVVEVAWTVRLQLLPDEREVHEAAAVELPETTGSEVGLVALKVMVAGLTVSVKLPASGEGSWA
jgi:hypothetical protein